MIRNRIAVIALALVGCTIAACVIGPKQDDPVADTPGIVDDAGSDFDGGLGVADSSGAADSVPATPDDARVGDAAADASDADVGDGDARDGDARDGDARDGDVGDGAPSETSVGDAADDADSGG